MGLGQLFPLQAIARDRCPVQTFFCLMLTMHSGTTDVKFAMLGKCREIFIVCQKQSAHPTASRLAI